MARLYWRPLTTAKFLRSQSTRARRRSAIEQSRHYSRNGSGVQLTSSLVAEVPAAYCIAFARGVESGLATYGPELVLLAVVARGGDGRRVSTAGPDQVGEIAAE